MENRQGSGDTARALIRQGATDEEALELLRFLHPDGKTTLRTVQSYRSRMRADFEDVPVGRDAPGLDRGRLRELIVSSDLVARETAVERHGLTAREVARASICEWKTNAQVLEEVLSVWPEKDYDTLDISDVRSRMRSKDERIPTDNEVRRWQAGEPWAADLTPPPELVRPG